MLRPQKSDDISIYKNQKFRTPQQWNKHRKRLQFTLRKSHLETIGNINEQNLLSSLLNSSFRYIKPWKSNHIIKIFNCILIVIANSCIYQLSVCLYCMYCMFICKSYVCVKFHPVVMIVIYLCILFCLCCIVI